MCGCLCHQMCQNPNPSAEIHVKISNFLLSVGLILGATSAAALSLGEVRGSVVLGRPLDVLFDVQPDPGTTLDPACLTATATVGDTHIDSSRMQVSVLPATAGRAQSVRVRSRVLVNEPILTVQLSAGCKATVSRTYHLFADPPATLVAAVLPVLPAERRPTADPVAASVAVSDPAVRADTQAAPPRRDQTAPLRRAVAPNNARKAQAIDSRKALPRQKPAKPAESAKRPITAPTSRLVVEPLEDGLLLPSALRLSSDLQALPLPDSSPERVQAAEHWKALNTSLDDSAGQAERVLALSAQAAAARAAAAQQQSAVNALQERLDRLEAERFSPTLVYALLALLAATLAGWGWYAWRTRREAAAATQGWRDAVATSAAREAQREGLPSRQGHVSANARLLDKDPDILLQDGGQVPRNAAAPAAVPTVFDLMTPSGAAPMPVSAPVVVAPVAPLSPAVPAMQVVPLEDLFDLQQQAEFFISVGEHDQAIEVMSKHIAQNQTASPWAYLELLRLYRSLSRVGPFNQLREQFQQHFNARVPDFAAFHKLNRHLLDYPEVLARIEALWSDDAVEPLLEDLLFCRNATVSVERFDLCAYDDLLMLYAIAHTTPASKRGVPPPRQRTTPVTDAAPLAPASLTPPVSLAFLAPLDMDDSASLAPSPSPSPSPIVADGNLLEYDLLPPRQGEPAAAPPAPVAPFDNALDIDLTEPDWQDSTRLPPITSGDLPAQPVTAAPAPGQPVGFGANSDRLEARFDLEARKPDVH